MIQLREPPEAPGWMPGVVRVRSLLGTFETIYIVTRQDGRWGVQARSSFAA